MQAERILIVGPSWVGDMVMTQSLLITLKAQLPQSMIDVLAPAWCHPLLQRMPEVSNAWVQDAAHGEFKFGSRFVLAKRLRSKNYQRAIIIPRSFKAALVPFLARIPRRTGYRGEMRFGLINDMRKLDKQVLTQTVQRYVALAGENNFTKPPNIPAPQLTVDKKNIDELIRRLNLKLDQPIVGIVPGAEYGPAKCWPQDYYIELSRQLALAGKQVWIFGSQKDFTVGDYIFKNVPSTHAGKVVNLCGKTSLVDVVDIISLADTVVTNDSGLMHIAAAVNCHVVAIYGSSTPDYTPPLTDNAKVIYKRLSCSPCFKRQCPLGHTHCLTQISVTEVMHAIES